MSADETGLKIISLRFTDGSILSIANGLPDGTKYTFFPINDNQIELADSAAVLLISTAVRESRITATREFGKPWESWPPQTIL